MLPSGDCELVVHTKTWALKTFDRGLASAFTCKFQKPIAFTFERQITFVGSWPTLALSKTDSTLQCRNFVFTEECRTGSTVYGITHKTHLTELFWEDF